MPPKIYIEEFSTGNRDEGEKWHQIGAEYDTENYGYRITELGEKFIEICELEEEKSQPHSRVKQGAPLLLTEPYVNLSIHTALQDDAGNW